MYIYIYIYINYKKGDLLKDLNFVMIHIIREMLVFLKFHLNYLKDDIVECFLRSIIDFYFFYFFLISKSIIMESLSPEEENIIKDIRNLWRLKKILN